MYKILCIYDNKNNLFTIKALLEQLDEIKVITASSAKDGLSILLSQSVDLIFLDIQMPEIDGFEASKLIKSNKHTAVFKSEEFKSRGYEVGAIEYINKPIDDYQLLNKVRLYKRLNESEKRLLAKTDKNAEIVIVDDILHENIEIINDNLKYHNIVLKTNYNSKTPISSYSRELLHVFMNIFNNAKGIDPEILTKIYDPYFSTKKEKNGTGLGLYICKTIVQKHLNGTIKALNSKDSGACIEISLPKVGVN